MRSARAVLDRHGLSLPLVALDGTIGVEARGGGAFHRAAFAAGTARRVVRALRAAGLGPCVYVDRPDVDIVVDGDASSGEAFLARNRAWIAHGDLERVTVSETVLAVSVVGSPDPRLGEAARALRGIAAASFTPDVVYGGHSLQVRPAGVSKWSGVAAFCRRHRVDAAGVLAVGDGANDVELLAHAAVACAVGGGAPAAVALADHLIAPPQAGGWAAVAALAAGLP